MATPLNNATFTTYLNQLDAPGWQGFADDLSTNFIGAFAGRFELTQRQNQGLALVTPDMQTQIVNSVQYAANGVAQGQLVDAEGSFFDHNPGAPQLLRIHVKVKPDLSIDDDGYISISIKIKFVLN